MTASERYSSGLAVRREVMGPDYVANALGSDEDCPTPLQQLVTEFGWGFVWSRDELSRPTRSLITVALLTGLNRPHELAGHARGALRNGCSPEDIQEAVLHCAPYAGIPAALDGMRVVTEVLAARRADPNAGEDAPGAL